MSNNSNHLKIIQYTFVTLLSLFIGIYFRLYPLLNFAPNDTHEKATLLVLSQVRSQIAQTIDQAKPDLPKQDKEVLIQQALDEIIHKESARVRATIQDLSQKMAAATDGLRREPYLLASDSYYYLSLTQNIVDTGKLAEEVKGSKYLNPLMLAPKGHWEPLNWHPYIGYFVTKIVRLFKPDASLMFGVSFTSLFMTALALLALACIYFHLRLSPLQAFVANVYFLLIPIFIKRSMFAWYDNDAYSVFFPLVITGLYFLALSRLDNKKYVMTIGVIGGFVFMIYAFFWQGWVFLFSTFVAASVFMSGCNQWIFKRKAQNKAFLLFVGIFLLSSFIFISLAFGFADFFILFQEGLKAISNFLTPQLSNWPDLYLSVGELFKSSLGLLVELCGGPVIIIVALFGILFSLIPNQKNNDNSLALKAILLLVYFSTALYLALGAQRFNILLVPPLAIGFGLGLKGLYELFVVSVLSLESKIKDIRPITGGIVSLAFLILTLLPMVSIKNAIPGLLNTIYNETWDSALTQLRENSPPNAIVNTWWTPGHFIKATARRAVTFDGATINVPQAYWMANVYLAPTEAEAVGILRMLNNSANGSFEYLEKLKFPVSDSVNLLKDITKTDGFQAKMILTAKLKNPTDVAALLKMTHDTPPPSYLLIFNELVEKNVQFGLFGKWNFKAIEKINQSPTLLAKIPSRNSKEYIDFLWQLVGGQYKFSEVLNQIKRIDKIAVFDHNLNVNLETKDCLINSPQYGRGVPASIFYLQDGQIVEKPQGKSNLSYSVVLLKDADRYEAILMDRPLAQSMLIKLYYFNGAGLKYFKPYFTASDLTKRTVIKIFSIDWEKFQNDYGL